MAVDLKKLRAVVCVKCNELTGHKTDGRILYDYQGNVENKSRHAGYYLIIGFICPSCDEGTVWSADIPQKIK